MSGVKPCVSWIWGIPGVAGLVFFGYWAKISPIAPGLITVVCFSAAGILALLTVRMALNRVSKRLCGVVDRITVLVVGLAVGVVLVEAALTVTAAFDWDRSGVQGIPREWRRRNVDVPGSVKSYYWHGVLHVHDANGMRRTYPFPDRSEDRCRVIIVGDSLTYGYGVVDGL